jgi:hypothetical protein
MQDMLLDNALKDAFTESGGRWDAAEGKGDSPFEVVRAYLKNGRCELNPLLSVSAENNLGWL